MCQLMACCLVVGCVCGIGGGGGGGGGASDCVGAVAVAVHVVVGCCQHGRQAGGLGSWPCETAAAPVGAGGGDVSSCCWINVPCGGIVFVRVGILCVLYVLILIFMGVSVVGACVCWGTHTHSFVDL
jgi:hypothetical protein